ncbi:MAG: glycerate kinase [Bacteroidota bacterium]
MHILLAPDKFKGSLSAIAIARAISKGLRASLHSIKEINIHPLADGGDGSLDVLASYLNLDKMEVLTLDPLERPIKSSYLCNEEMAFIEVASASGLVLLSPSERNPRLTSTLGTGLLIKNALERGITQIYLFLGGSATNDLGFGILAALGFELLDAAGNQLLPIGDNLGKVHTIVPSESYNWSDINFTVLCDVDNPPFGPNGAAYVYAAQKGASLEDIAFLDAGLQSSCAVIQQQSGKYVAQLAGGGAAGGIATSLFALLNARIQPGFQLLSELTFLEDRVQKADIVISGEGKLDRQSLRGKVVDGVAKLCQKHNKPLYLFVGANELAEKDWKEHGIQAVYQVISLANELEDAMLNAEQYLEQLGQMFGERLKVD